MLHNIVFNVLSDNNNKKKIEYATKYPCFPLWLVMYKLRVISPIVAHWAATIR